MPSTYAHYTFAKQVAEMLPDSLSHICSEYETQYLFGSQGPDFFYFYRPQHKNHYTEIGSLLHSCTLNRFLRQITPIVTLYGPDSMEYAYTLGFICHFALDGFCHPYIIPQAKSMKFPHVCMETEFDRYLMAKDGEDPLRYPLQQLIPTDDKTRMTLHHIYPDIPEEVIFTCLKTYRHYRKLWVTPTRLRYVFSKTRLKLRPRSGYFCNFLLPMEPRPLSKATNPELDRLFQEAVPAGASYLESFHESFTKGLELDERFERNFK